LTVTLSDRTLLQASPAWLNARALDLGEIRAGGHAAVVDRIDLQSVCGPGDGEAEGGEAEKSDPQT